MVGGPEVFFIVVDSLHAMATVMTACLPFFFTLAEKHDICPRLVTYSTKRLIP